MRGRTAGKERTMNFFKNNKCEAEIDIEHTDVIAIERKFGVSVFSFVGNTADVRLACSPSEHCDFVRRFRQKIGRPIHQP